MIILLSSTGAYCNVFQNVMGKQLRINRELYGQFCKSRHLGWYCASIKRHAL